MLRLWQEPVAEWEIQSESGLPQPSLLKWRSSQAHPEQYHPSFHCSQSQPLGGEGREDSHEHFGGRGYGHSNVQHQDLLHPWLWVTEAWVFWRCSLKRWSSSRSSWGRGFCLQETSWSLWISYDILDVLRMFKPHCFRFLFPNLNDFLVHFESLKKTSAYVVQPLLTQHVYSKASMWDNR